MLGRAVPDRFREPTSRGSQNRAAVVRQAEEYMLAHPDRNLSLLEICEVVGASQTHPALRISRADRSIAQGLSQCPQAESTPPGAERGRSALEFGARARRALGPGLRRARRGLSQAFWRAASSDDSAAPALIVAGVTSQKGGSREARYRRLACIFSDRFTTSSKRQFPDNHMICNCIDLTMQAGAARAVRRA